MKQPVRPQSSLPSNAKMSGGGVIPPPPPRRSSGLRIACCERLCLICPSSLLYEARRDYLSNAWADSAGNSGHGTRRFGTVRVTSSETKPAAATAISAILSADFACWFYCSYDPAFWHLPRMRPAGLAALRLLGIFHIVPKQSRPVLADFMRQR